LTGRVSRILNSVEYLIDIHLSMTEKYPSVEDAKEGMLKIAIKMFNNEKKLEEIYKKIIEEFKHLDKDKLIAEIDSWGLDTLY
jgi:formate dehydrogenase maturation protein FdhE